MHLNKKGPKYDENSNMAGFSSVIQHFEYAAIYHDKVLNTSWILNVPGFWTWLCSDYAVATQSSKYITICLNMSK